MHILVTIVLLVLIRGDQCENRVANSRLKIGLNSNGGTCLGRRCTALARLTRAQTGGYFVHMQLRTENAHGSTWIAVGFSRDDKMGDDAVLECAQGTNGSVMVGLSLNLGREAKKGNLVAKFKDVTGVVSLGTATADGLIQCSWFVKPFFRIIVRNSHSPVIFENGQRPTQTVNLRKREYFVLLAYGQLDELTGSKRKHLPSSTSVSRGKVGSLARYPRAEEESTVGSETGETEELAVTLPSVGLVQLGFTFGLSLILMISFAVWMCVLANCGAKPEEEIWLATPSNWSKYMSRTDAPKKGKGESKISMTSRTSVTPKSAVSTATSNKSRV